MNKEAKVGRNAPCPCGSGKKYKHCCQLNNTKSISGDPFIHYNQLMSSAKLKLEHYCKNDLRKHRKELQSQFTSFTTQKYLIKDHESILSDWVWFDLKDDAGLSAAGNYLRKNRDYMEASLRECLEALNSSYISVYRLTGSQDRVLLINDVFLNIDYQVILKEPLFLKENGPEKLLLARLVQLPDVNILSGMALILEDGGLQGDFIKEHFYYVRELYDLETKLLLKDCGEMIYGIFEHAGTEASTSLKPELLECIKTRRQAGVSN